MTSHARLRLASLALVVSFAACGGNSNPTKIDGGYGGSGASDASDTGAGGGDAAPPDVAVDRGGDTGAKDALPDTTTPVDSGPPPTMFTVTVLDRRQTSFLLRWPAPSNNGQAVTGYQVRYAKVPITDANFDNTAVTTAVPFTGTPAAPGAAESMVIRNLYIENKYYFAVAGTVGSSDAGAAPDGGAGNRLAIMTNATAVGASFQVALLPSPTGTAQLFGAQLDGTGDANGDNLSDLLVATAGDAHAYLYFGNATFAPTAPAVVFTGANMFFGSAVRFIGDIDGDGMQDIAIGDQTGNQVFIYKGRSTWPPTLSDTQANYTITTDATWAMSGFGFGLAPLGDFDGDNIDDFVVSAPSFAPATANPAVGRVAVIYGRSGFTSFALPSTTRSLEIAGDVTLDRSQFGQAVTGLGHFYTVATGTTLIVSAPGRGNATSTSANEGRLYAFHGRGPGAAIAATAADHTRLGPDKAAKIGQNLVNLGPLVNTLPSVGSGNNADTVTMAGVSGSAYVLSGAVGTGPFATVQTFIQSGSTGIGQIVFGGAFSGRDMTVSMIGDAKPDLAIGSQASSTGTPATLDIFDGSKVAALTGTIDSTASADVHVPMPSGWLGAAPGIGNLIKDINGDGYPDFALGDQFNAVPGRVVVFY